MDQVSPSHQITDDNYSWNYDGNGVRIYVVDTGVLPSHPEFGSRVDPLPELATALTQAGRGLGSQCWTFREYTAAASHGTAVAAVAAGNTLGVAKLATIVDARALQCGLEPFSTTTARLTFVLNWIATSDTRRQSGKSVVNLSLSYAYVFGDPNYSAVANQIGVLVDTYNIPVVTAAGNFNDNAYWYGPGNSLRAINIGGLSKNSSSRWSFSNYGYNILFYAPAQYVESTSTLPSAAPGTFEYRSALDDCNMVTYPADTCTSGTSFSAPHAAGVIARYLQRFPGASRDAIVSALQSSSSTYGGQLVAQPSGPGVPVLVYRD
jgi:subtilisin family serine protease